jgi:hypothetical protein
MRELKTMVLMPSSNRQIRRQLRVGWWAAVGMAHSPPTVELSPGNLCRLPPTEHRSVRKFG